MKYAISAFLMIVSGVSGYFINDKINPRYSVVLMNDGQIDKKPTNYSVNIIPWNGSTLNVIKGVWG